MRSVKFLIIALMSIATLASCNKEGDGASLALSRTALYFSSWNDNSQVISYVATNTVSVGVGSISNGWEAFVNATTKEILVTPVGATDDTVSEEELPKEGVMVINALNKENQATSYMINLYICETVAVDRDGASNCYVVTAPNTNYTFDAMNRPDGSSLETASVKLLWQSNPEIVNNVDIVGGKAQFYVAPSAEDTTRLEDTNAVIAAYNAVGEVIWSWHLWIVNENPLTATTTYQLNGEEKVFMNMNLGAFTNANGSADEQKIHDSYGMYYQWGRKDPFPRPYYFDASGAEAEGCFNGDNYIISGKFEECSATTGTVAYTVKNPMTYITNATCIEEGGDGVGDWLAVADNTLWNDTEKSLYDPCPKGWRVPTARDLATLKLTDNNAADNNEALENARGQYGWNLSGDVGSAFWSACGRRRYNDGKIENMNSKEGVYPSQPQPWEGYYWTSSTTADGKAVSLYFDLTTTRVNKFSPNHSARRANGFQVRCVKE